VTIIRNSPTPLIALACVAVTVFTSGCGEKLPTRVPVSGTVTIDGVPLAYGSIMFINDSTRPAGSVIDAQGRFTLSCYTADDGAIVGRHKVKVTAAQPLGTDQVRWLAPKKYADENTSGIEKEVTEPVSDMKIELTWAGGKPFVER
jgi:hypothetical protein